MGVAARWLCGAKGLAINTLREMIRMSPTARASGKARSILKGR